MRDNRPAPGPREASANVSRIALWFQRLEQTKLSPLIVVGFIALLGVMAGVAWAIGYFTHHMFAR